MHEIKFHVQIPPVEKHYKLLFPPNIWKTSLYILNDAEFLIMSRNISTFIVELPEVRIRSEKDQQI